MTAPLGCATWSGGAAVDASNLIRALGEDGAIAADSVPALMVFDGPFIYMNYKDLPEVVPGQLPRSSAPYRQLIGVPQWPDEGTVSAHALAAPAPKHVLGIEALMGTLGPTAQS